MLELQLLKDHFQHLYFEGINGGKSRFTKKTDSTPELSTIVSQNEFDQFLKENNLILYKDMLKQYEDGEIIGYFHLQE